jgi:hypothetical protein
LDFGDDPPPRYPVHLNDKDVSDVTDDADGLGAVLHRLHHVAAAGDVCFSMRDDTVQLVHEVYVVWESVATKVVVDQAIVRCIVSTRGPRSLLVVSVEHDDILGARRVVSQSLWPCHLRPGD